MRIALYGCDNSYILQYKVSSNYTTVVRHFLVGNSQSYSLKYIWPQVLMTTKCTQFLFCWYVVATYIENTFNTNTSNPKLVFQKISKRKYINRKYMRKLITRVTLRHLSILKKQEDIKQ